MHKNMKMLGFSNAQMLLLNMLYKTTEHKLAEHTFKHIPQAYVKCEPPSASANITA